MDQPGSGLLDFETQEVVKSMQLPGVEKRGAPLSHHILCTLQPGFSLVHSPDASPAITGSPLKFLPLCLGKG